MNDKMKNNFILCSILLVLAASTGFTGCNHIPFTTVLWEEDTEGFVRFYTDDPDNYCRCFFTWYEEYFQPEMSQFEIQVKRLCGFGSSGYGMIFCVQDENNFYVLLVNAMGYFAVYELYDGAWIEKIQWQKAFYTLVEGYNVVNTLKIVYYSPSNRFEVEINGRHVWDFYDDSFSGGYFGCFVEIRGQGEDNFYNNPVDVRFKMNTGI